MLSGDDDELLGHLRRVAAQADPSPGTVFEAADAAIETRNLDDRLAELVADSREPVPRAEPMPVRGGDRGADHDRMLSYAAEGIGIDLAVQPEDGVLTIIGQFTGAAAEDCRLERPDGTFIPVLPDDLGRFFLPGLAPGPVRVRCRSASGIPVVTEWLLL